MDPSSLQTLGDKGLYDFLVNVPKDFRENERIRKYQLKNGDYIHCVLWNYHFYITGTDIVKILIWRFQYTGRQIGTIKKFEEGIFSDLRNLKPGVDATLEGPRSEFLEFLYKNGCIRTQKKQKVFYWYSVPHDELFCDALERDLRRDTSIYTYNRYVQDPQRMQMAEMGGKPLPMYHKLNSTLLAGEGMAQPRYADAGSRSASPAKDYEMAHAADAFGIKDVLFGKSKAPSQADPWVRPEMRPSSSCFSAGAFMKGMDGSGLAPGYKMPAPPQSRSAEPVAEPRAQRIKNALECNLEFDEFDLGQFEFLKERCNEYFTRKNENCEQKLFEDKKKDEPISGIDRRGEIRFVDNKDKTN